jgi:pseudouridine kinase
MAPRILCIGGATVDRIYRLNAPLVPETSNPAAGASGFGGVARNVAENLGRLGIAIELLTRVGDDAAGAALLRQLAAAGVGARGVLALPGQATADYVAVLTPDGDLALGLAAMAIFDRLTPEALEGHAGLLAEADWVFADCNLPAASLLALVGRRWGGAYRLAVDAVSVAKAARLPASLAGIDLLFVNRDEAAALLARHGRHEAEPAAVAEGLRSLGAGAVVVTLGAEGAVVAEAAGVARVPAEAATVVDVTGAGDALIAATLAARASGETLVEALRRGCAAAARAVAAPAATGLWSPSSTAC